MSRRPTLVAVVPQRGEDSDLAVYVWAVPTPYERDWIMRIVGHADCARCKRDASVLHDSCIYRDRETMPRGHRREHCTADACY